MKQKINFIILFTFLISSIGFTQISDVKKTSLDKLTNDEKFNDLNVEKFFTQTNKSTYFNEENISFKTYVVNENDNKPFIGKSNLYLSLFNINGELLETNIYYLVNGIAYGEFYINKEYETGIYYLQANTNYNRNFTNNTYNKINIVNVSKKEDHKAELNKTNEKELVKISTPTNSLNLIFYPESNQIIENITNKVLFQFNTKEIIYGNLINKSTNKIISKIKSDINGIGTIFYFSNSDINYKVEVNYNNELLSFDLPKPKKLGFTIFKNIQSDNSTSTDFIVKTNKITISNIENEELFAVIHRNGSLKTILTFKINKEKLNYLLKLDNTTLFQGLNTLSIFNTKNKLLVERNFYNNLGFDSKKIFCLKNEKSSDSLKIGFKSTEDFKNGNISVSVHDVDYNITDKNNIISEFNINHFLNINFDFNELLLKDNVWEIDNYIQILNSNIKSYPYENLKNENLLFKPESGVNINGILNTEIKNLEGYKVLLTSKENNLFVSTDFYDINKFTFENLFIRKLSNFQLALLDEKGKVIKSNFVILKNSTPYNSNLNLRDLQNFQKINKKEQSIKASYDDDFINFNEVTVLDEVEINADFEKGEKKEKLKNAINRNAILGMTSSRVYDTRDILDRSLNLGQYIESIPGVTVVYLPDYTTVLKNDRYIRTINSPAIPKFIIAENGVPFGNDFTVYQNRSIDEFDYIIVNYTGAGYGLQDGQGVITLILRTDYSSSKNIKSNIREFEAEIGFNIPSKRYKNSFINYGSESNENKINCLDWFPNIKLSDEKIEYINVYTKGKDKVKLIINGINEDGKLYHQIIQM
tara:strand:+ start:1658 stop:4105 length:2448 start_codon:yes stop_codon:yes gene_type:complete